MPNSALSCLRPRVPNSALGGAKSAARVQLTFALMHMMDMARALLEHKGAGEPVFK